MSRDRAPLPSHLFAVAACASAGVSGAAGPLMYLGAAALGAWALLEGFVPARVPRPLARAVDLLAASTVVLVLIARPGGLPEALRLSAQALLVAQLSRVLRRKHRGDVMAMHGIAILHLAVGAFLTRADSWLAWFCGCLVFGTVASVRLITRSTGSPGESRVILADVPAPGRAWAGPAQTVTVLGVLLALTTVVFVLLPRSPAFDSREVGAARAEDPDPTDYTKDTEEGAFRITGFSARVRLGDVGRIKQAPWPAFVVQITEGGRPTPVSPAHLYFRGRTLQVFDGREWSSGEPEPEPTGLLELPSRLHVQDARGAARLLVQEYVLRPSSSDVIFALDTPCWLELDRALPRVIARADGTFRAPSAPGEGLVYRAGSRLPSAGHRGLAAWPPPSAACLALPPVSERLVSAAGSAAGSGDPESRGRRIAEWVRSRCEYTLAFTGDPEGSPVEDFLFGTMAGHCEYFAAATAVLLRAAGLPSRLVVGYRGGLWLADEEAYLLRQSDAHAWVESWVDGRGWMRLDATPADDRAVRVPPSRLPGAAPETTRPSVDLVALVRRFGPEDRARVLRGLSGAAAFALREGIGVGRPRRHFPPPVPALGVLLVALLSARWLLRRARLRAGGALREKRAIPPSEDFYREALRRLRRRGLPRSTSLTPREFEEGVRSRLGEDGPVFRDITMAFEETRYGGRPLAKETGRLLRRKCRTLGGARRAQPDAAD